MGKPRSYTPFFASALLMYVLLLAIYPHYQYYIDPDGTAYLTISQRYANGDIARAINGYWSPWSCWLTAGAIKCGMAAIPASWLINALGATGFLYISQSFFLKFNIINKLQWLLNITLALFLCYAIFWQSFDDLWECFFLLAVLRMMLAERFARSPTMWLVCGITGALAYFAKAYAFPFFILNTLCCVYLITRGNTRKWLQVSSVAILTMIVCSIPWLIALHNKYGIWTTSTAGSLNMSWYLIGHPYYKEGIDLLIPPTYPDSPSYWEDPWYANGAAPHFWNSWHLFGLQLLRVGLNSYKFIMSGLQLSIFFPVIFIVALLSLFRKKVRNLFSGNARIMVISFLLFPLAYFLINFESRYIWYMLPLAMVMGATAIQVINSRVRRLILSWLFPVTFLVFPVFKMDYMYDAGSHENKLAAYLRSIDGPHSFTGNINSRYMIQVAYLSGDQFYYIPDRDVDTVLLAKDIRRYNLDYYFSSMDKGTSFRPNCNYIFFDAFFSANNDHLLKRVEVDSSLGIGIYKITKD